jgi:hypothetical protein
MNVFRYTNLVSFVAGSSMDLAVNRLRKGVQRENPLSALTAFVPKATLIGHVDPYSVELHCTRPFISFLFKPHFYGKFLEKNGQVVLEGQFVVSMFARVLVLTFVVVTALMEIVFVFGTPTYSSGPSLPVPSTVIPPVMALGALSLIFLSKWIFKGDVRWISEQIERLLADRRLYDPRTTS